MSEKRAEAERRADDSAARKWAAGVSDHEIAEKAKAAKNGPKYLALTEGKWKEAGYTSEARAVVALAMLTAFYYGKDPERIEAHMRGTKLRSAAWDKPVSTAGKTFIARQIETALAKQEEFYRPTKSPSSRANHQCDCPATEPELAAAISLAETAAQVAQVDLGEEYSITGGSFFTGKNRLTNFEAKIVEEIVRDDGVSRPARNFRIELNCLNRNYRPECSAEEFGAMTWLPRECGALPVIYPIRYSKEAVRACIQLNLSSILRPGPPRYSDLAHP